MELIHYVAALTGISYVWALGLYLDLRRLVSKLTTNHLKHLEDRVLGLEQAETRRTQGESDSAAVDRFVQSRLRSLEAQSASDREAE